MKELVRRLRFRSQHKVFHPDAAQEIIDIGSDLFVVQRERAGEWAVCISNFTDRYMELKLDDRLPRLGEANSCFDILTGQRYMGKGKVVALDAYQTVWLLV